MPQNTLAGKMMRIRSHVHVAQRLLSVQIWYTYQTDDFSHVQCTNRRLNTLMFCASIQFQCYVNKVYERILHKNNLCVSILVDIWQRFSSFFWVHHKCRNSKQQHSLFIYGWICRIKRFGKRRYRPDTYSYIFRTLSCCAYKQTYLHTHTVMSTCIYFRFVAAALLRMFVCSCLHGHVLSLSASITVWVSYARRAACWIRVRVPFRSIAAAPSSKVNNWFTF